MFYLTPNTCQNIVVGLALVIFALGLGTLIGLISKFLMPLLIVGTIAFVGYKLYSLLKGAKA